MADTASDFLRVKSLWPTRIGRSRSKETEEKPRAPSMVSPEEEVEDYRPSVLEFTIESQAPYTPKEEQYPVKDIVVKEIAEQDVVHVFTPRKLSDNAPRSPIFAASSSFPFEDIDDASKPTAQQNDVDAPTSPASAASTSPSMPSPSMSPSKPPMNPVTSMFRTFSDARIFASSSDSSPKSNASSGLFSSSLPVPSMPSWRMPFSNSSAKKDSPTSSPPSSTLLPFNAIPTPWRITRASSDSSCSNSSSSSAFSFPSVSLMSALPPRVAAENAITNVHQACPRYKAGSACTNISRGSPYGELVVVDVLAARDLLVDRDEDGVDIPFRVTMQLSNLSRQTAPASRATFAVNERFVFWLPSSPVNDQRTLDVFVHGSDERDLGEVHLSLAMPVNETFESWYPLVCRADGHKHGSLRVAMRRLVLTSSPMLEAGKSLSSRRSCLTYGDQNLYGELLPELWTSFPSAEPASPSTPTEDPTAMNLSRRLMGTTEPVIHRDVF